MSVARWKVPTCGVAALLYLLSCVPASGNDGADDASKDTQESHEYEALYLLFVCVLLGAAVLHLTTLPRLRNVPVTVVFFVFGIGLGLAAEALGKSSFKGMQWLFNSYERWAAIDPHLVLFTFLPALLFSDAMAVDTHVAMRCAGQCLLLAGPGVVIGSFTTAAMFYWIIPYGWSFTMCVMIGSILSATDPVAVVSLLKDLGASPVLTLQIQGEAMLNDGTAMVLFLMAYGMVSGEQYDAFQMILNPLKSTIGAWILGMALGHGFFRWIRASSDKLCHKNPLIQLLLTICCAYLSYLIADGYFHISGVLSTVAAALVLAHQMWPVVVEREAMLEFWHVVETIGNILVFSLAGMLTGQSFLNHEFLDYLWVLFIYVALTVIRFATMIVLWPLLNASGQRIRWPSIVVMTWGGLRGMVGLALAILVREDRAKGSIRKEDGDRVLFIVGCIAALTLVINATTCPALCGILGLTQTVEGRLVLIRNVALRADQHVNEVLNNSINSGQLSRECQLTTICETVQLISNTVKQHVFGEDFDKSMHGLLNDGCRDLGQRQSILDTKLRMRKMSTRSSLVSTMDMIWQSSSNATMDTLWNKFHAAKTDMIEAGGQITQFKIGRQLSTIKSVLSMGAIDHQQLRIVREVFFEAVRVHYWEMIEAGHFMWGDQEPQMLLDSVSIALQRSDECLSDWYVLERYIRWNDDTFTKHLRKWNEACKRQEETMSWYTQFKRWYHESCLKRHFRKQMRALQIAKAFMVAHAHAQTKIAAYFGPDEEVDSPEEAYVIVESQTQVFAAGALSSKISKPVQQFMTTSWEVDHLCERYRKFIISTHEHGVLNETETELLLEPVVEVLRKIRRQQLRMNNAFADTGITAQRSTKRSTRQSMAHLDAVVVVQRAYRQSLSHLPRKNRDSKNSQSSTCSAPDDASPQERQSLASSCDATDDMVKSDSERNADAEDVDDDSVLSV